MGLKISLGTAQHFFELEPEHGRYIYRIEKSVCFELSYASIWLVHDLAPNNKLIHFQRLLTKVGLWSCWEYFLHLFLHPKISAKNVSYIFEKNSIPISTLEIQGSLNSTNLISMIPSIIRFWNCTNLTIFPILCNSYC